MRTVELVFGPHDGLKVELDSSTELPLMIEYEGGEYHLNSEGRYQLIHARPDESQQD